MFEGSGVVVDRVLDHERDAQDSDGGEMIQERRDVLRPEHDAVDGLRRQINAARLSVVRVDCLTVPRFQAVHEPAPVESWNVGLVAGRDDHKDLL